MDGFIYQPIAIGIECPLFFLNSAYTYISNDEIMVLSIKLSDLMGIYENVNPILI